MEAVLRHSSDSKSCRNGILINVLFSYFGFVVYDKKKFCPGLQLLLYIAKKIA